MLFRPHPCFQYSKAKYSLRKCFGIGRVSNEMVPTNHLIFAITRKKKLRNMILDDDFSATSGCWTEHEHCLACCIYTQCHYIRINGHKGAHTFSARRALYLIFDCSPGFLVMPAKYPLFALVKSQGLSTEIKLRMIENSHWLLEKYFCLLFLLFVFICLSIYLFIWQNLLKKLEVGRSEHTS